MVRFFIVLLLFSPIISFNLVDTPSKDQQIVVLKGDTLVQQFRENQINFNAFSAANIVNPVKVMKKVMRGAIFEAGGDPCRYVMQDSTFHLKYPNEYRFFKMVCENDTLLKKIKNNHPVYHRLSEEEHTEIFYK